MSNQTCKLIIHIKAIKGIDMGKLIESLGDYINGSFVRVLEKLFFI